MPRERYIPAKNQWLSYPEADWDQFITDVNTQVGAKVPLSVQSTGEIVVDFDNLPSGVSENDVKQAVKDNHPHR